MMGKREELLEKIFSCYRGCYDIEMNSEEGDPLVATAVFHEHQTGYILVRKAEMWSADRHEYSYFFLVPRLTTEIFRDCVERAKKLGLERIDTPLGHMCSNIVALFITDTADPEAVKELKKYKFYKSYMFTIKGWTTMQTALASLEEDVFVSNSAGRHVREFLRSLVHPKAKKKRRGFSIADMVN